MQAEQARAIEEGTFDLDKVIQRKQVFDENLPDLTDIKGDTIFGPHVPPDQQATIGGNQPTAVGAAEIRADDALAAKRHAPASAATQVQRGQIMVDGRWIPVTDNRDGTVTDLDGNQHPIPLSGFFPLEGKDALATVQGFTTAEQAIESADATLNTPREEGARTFVGDQVVAASGLLDKVAIPTVQAGLGAFGLEGPFPRTADAHTFLRFFREVVVERLVKNQRFPVAEQERILKLAPKGVIFDLPTQLANVRQLEKSLLSALRLLRDQLSASTTEKDRNELSSVIRETIDAIQLVRQGPPRPPLPDGATERQQQRVRAAPIRPLGEAFDVPGEVLDWRFDEDPEGTP